MSVRQRDVAAAVKGAVAAASRWRASKWTRMAVLLSSPASRVKPPMVNALDAWMAKNARRLKGINSKRKRLADGSFRTYWWA